VRYFKRRRQGLARLDGVVSLKFLKRFLKQIAKDKHINIDHNYFQIKADAQSFVI
jgi:hypothetical protein